MELKCEHTLALIIRNNLACLRDMNQLNWHILEVKVKSHAVFFYLILSIKQKPSWPYMMTLQQTRLGSLGTTCLLSRSGMESCNKTSLLSQGISGAAVLWLILFHICRKVPINSRPRTRKSKTSTCTFKTCCHVFVGFKTLIRGKKWQAVYICKIESFLCKGKVTLWWQVVWGNAIILYGVVWHW